MRDLTPAESKFLNTDNGHSGLTCIFCACPEFFEGPSGGMSLNIKCGNPKCAAKYNITPGFAGFNEQIIAEPIDGGLPLV
jgi:hypothetical protein